MKFIRLGNWLIRVEKILAVRVGRGEDRVTVYCENDKEYSMMYDNHVDALDAYLKLLAELEK